MGKRYACRMLGKWLQDGLKAAGVSQAELARQLTQALGRSIDRAAVNKMVAGDRSIKADEMLEITRILQSAPPGQSAEACSQHDRGQSFALHVPCFAP